VTDSPQVRMGLLAGGRFLAILQVSALGFPIRRPEIKVLPVEPPMADMPFKVEDADAHGCLTDPH